MVKLSKIITITSAFVSLIVWALLIYAEKNVANEYYVTRGESLSISTYVSVSGDAAACNSQGVNKQKAVLKLFGIFPIKEVGITVKETVAVLDENCEERKRTVRKFPGTEITDIYTSQAVNRGNNFNDEKENK